jgi:DNA-binding NtrC family response regulator
MAYNIDIVENKAPPVRAMDGMEMLPSKQIEPKHSIRSLVVDNDHTILNSVAQMLSMLDYPKVDMAQNWPELINKLNTNGPYDLMMTDLEMPDMNGFHLSQMIKKEVYGTKVIIMAGCHENDCLEMMATRWVDGWLFKPFGTKQLRNMLQWLGLLKY